MKKKQAVLFVVLILFIATAIGIKIELFEFMGFFMPNSNDLNRKYIKCQDELYFVCEYLSDDSLKKYDIVRIDIFDSATKIYCSEKDCINGEYKKRVYSLTDKKLINSFKTLKKNGFSIVLKEYNYISFSVWSSFGSGVDLIYSPDEKPYLSEINAEEKVLKKLKYPGWYYLKSVY